MLVVVTTWIGGASAGVAVACGAVVAADVAVVVVEVVEGASSPSSPEHAAKAKSSASVRMAAFVKYVIPVLGLSIIVVSSEVWVFFSAG